MGIMQQTNTKYKYFSMNQHILRFTFQHSASSQDDMV
jgi:hypothetical protein